MRIPRWTVYPALALIAVFLVTAIPSRREPVDPGAPVGPAQHKRVVVLGIDGMDPEFLAETIELCPDRMRNFAKLIEEGGIHSLGTSNPPQSPVAWSNFITGFDPGGHGIFDFIHRDPVTRAPAGSTTVDEKPTELSLPGKWKLPLSGGGGSNRTGESFWMTLARNGIPADVWRMPANFPVEPAEGLSFPGMMTPALDSAYGEFTLYTTDPPLDTGVFGGRIETVRAFGDRIRGAKLQGPPNPFHDGDPHVTVGVDVYLDEQANAAAIEVDGKSIVLEAGQWSDFVQVNFPLLPMGLKSISGAVRFYLRSVSPEFEMYASPVNIDPMAPATPVAEPVNASADLAESIGIYYTQGMAEEVNGLKARVLTDAEFMDQAQLVYDERVRMMDYALDEYLESDDGGLLFFYYSTVDLCSHMMWRHHDAEHPHHDAGLAGGDSSAWSGRDGSRWKDVIHDLYMRMDPVLGRLRERIGEDALLFVMSDHGFASYRRKFNLNTWLLDEGYLVLKDGAEREKPRGTAGRREVYIYGGDVDWSKTRAYGMGFNGLYLNLAGREADDPLTDEDESGIVRPEDAEALLREISAKLVAVKDPADGAQAILSAELSRDIYHGERTAEAPDILVGYNAGYGNSDASSTGRIPHDVFEDNTGGTFNGNHLMAPEVVAGTLLTNGEVAEGQHRLEDLTVEILRQYGIQPGPGLEGHPVLR